MLERMLIAEAGRRGRTGYHPCGFDTPIQRRSDMTARRHLFNTEVRPTVPEPTEDELRTAFRRSNTRIRAQQKFFCPPPVRKSTLCTSCCRTGADFDRLGRGEQKKVQRAGSAQGTRRPHGLGHLHQLDEAPENVLFATQRHHIAPAVASLRGVVAYFPRVGRGRNRVHGRIHLQQSSRPTPL